MKSRLPLIAFIACGLIWGSTFLAIRVGNDALPALWACSLRFFVAAIILNSILLITRQPWPKGAVLKAALWYGFYEFGLSMPILYWGERVVPSGLAAVLYAVCPVVAMITARLMGLEQLTFKRLGAAVFAFLGVAVIFWKELVSGGSTPGLVAILLAACAAPIAGLMLQKGPRQNSIGVNGIGVLVGLAFSLAASFALGEPHPIPTTTREIFPVIYLAIMGSVGAFVIFAWLVHHWRATTIAFLGVIVPVIAVILGAVVRQESLAPGSLVGAVIVIAGVTIALRSENGEGSIAAAH